MKWSILIILLFLVNCENPTAVKACRDKCVNEKSICFLAINGTTIVNKTTPFLLCESIYISCEDRCKKSGGGSSKSSSSRGGSRSSGGSSRSGGSSSSGGGSGSGGGGGGGGGGGNIGLF